MSTRPSAPRLVACTSAAAFAVLAVVVGLTGSFPGDEALLRVVTDVSGTRFDRLARLVGDLTDPVPLLVLTGIVLAMLLLAGRPRPAALLATCLAVALVVNPWWKDLVDRPRPDVRPIPEPVSPLAFPAGHAANTAAVVGGLLLGTTAGRRRLAVLGGAVVLGVVAWSRLVVGAHHPSDLLAGWLWVGAVVAVLWDHRDRP